jgi:hypothetical protein
MPFANDYERDSHFMKHGHKFNVLDAFEYERMADAFMFGPMSLDTRESDANNKINRIRFCDSNRHFGVARIRPAYLRTFYPISVGKIAAHGGYEGFFNWECGKLV